MVRPAEPVGLARRRLGHAALGVDLPALDGRRGQQLVALGRVAGSAARPQPGDARRRVARTALVVWRPPGRIAGGDSGRSSHIPDRDGPTAAPSSSLPTIAGTGKTGALRGSEASHWTTPPTQRARAPPSGLVGRSSAGLNRSPAIPRPTSRPLTGVPEPGERLRRFGSAGFGGWRHGGTFPTSGIARVQLAHPVDEAAGLGLVGRPGLRRQPLARPPEELGEPAVGLEVAPDHHAVVRLERLRHPVDQRPREPQRVADLAHRRARPVGHEVADHPRVLGAVAPVDVLDDLLPPLVAEVDVDVGVGRPALVDEPLEQEAVGDRVDPGDPEHVRHDRARRAAPALRRDPLLLREPHQVPADQEELGEAGLLDDVELVGEPLDHRRGQRVIACRAPAWQSSGEVRERRLAGGTGKPGKR